MVSVVGQMSSLLLLYNQLDPGSSGPLTWRLAKVSPLPNIGDVENQDLGARLDIGSLFFVVSQGEISRRESFLKRGRSSEVAIHYLVIYLSISIA